MSEKLVEYELQVLRSVNGDFSAGLAWGAAYIEALVRLHSMGYLSRYPSAGGPVYIITTTGRAALTMEKTG
jgi:hypothetical protein